MSGCFSLCYVQFFGMCYVQFVASVMYSFLASALAPLADSLRLQPETHDLYFYYIYYYNQTFSFWQTLYFSNVDFKHVCTKSTLGVGASISSSFVQKQPNCLFLLFSFLPSHQMASGGSILINFVKKTTQNRFVVFVTIFVFICVVPRMVSIVSSLPHR